MSWFSYLYPQTVLRASTEFNRDIRVVETAGTYKLLVNGSSQSGPYIESLWKKVFARFGIGKIRPRRVLVLGVGGGTVIKLLYSIFPHVHITAVDIDPYMTQLGYEFFLIPKAVKIVYQDARKYVRSSVNRYDLIIVDLFSGRDIPKFVASTSFLRSLSMLLAKDGCILFNYLREKEYRELSDDFFFRLKRIYPEVFDCKLFLNRFFMVS